MKVIEKTLTEEAIEKREYRNALSIEIDGVLVFYVYDGESEDANLSRDFSPCHNIVFLMQKAWDAGRKGETFSIEKIKVDEID